MHCSESAFGDMNVVLLYLISFDFCKYLLQVFSILGHLLYPWRILLFFRNPCQWLQCFCIPQSISETGRALCHLWASPGSDTCRVARDNPRQVTPGQGRDGMGQPWWLWLFAVTSWSSATAMPTVPCWELLLGHR